MKLGLSLSFCVRDIAEGKVNIEDVHHIVTGCSPQNEDDVTGIVEQYSKTYWSKLLEPCLAVFSKLRASHRIMWCSTFEKNPPRIGGGVWLDMAEHKP